MNQQACNYTIKDHKDKITSYKPLLKPHFEVTDGSVLLWYKKSPKKEKSCKDKF